MTIEVDTSALFAALDRLGSVAEKHVKAAAKVTAERIEREAERRIARRTGETAKHVRVEETHDGLGYIVLSNNPGDRNHVDRYLEFGTAQMPARPFFFISAALEEGAHLRRVEQAVQAAIDESGLGA